MIINSRVPRTKARGPKRWVVCYKKASSDKMSYLYVVSASDEEEAWELTKKKFKLGVEAALVYAKCTS